MVRKEIKDFVGQSEQNASRHKQAKPHAHLYFWFDTHASIILHSFLSRIGNRWHTTTINMDCTTRKRHTTW